MADDITLTVGFSDVILAEKAAASLEKRFKDLVTSSKRNASSSNDLYAVFKKLNASGLSLSKVFTSIDRDQKMAANSAAKLEKELLGVNLANKSARESARAMEAAFKAQDAATKTLKDNNRRLRMEFKEGYAAQVQYRAARMRLSQAERDGIVTAQQAAAAQKNLGVQLQQGGRHMSRSGVMTQQAGYQMGDFLVQVQGGTNWMVAFGQQATQMVGALYMLPASTLAASVGFMGLRISVTALIASMGIIIPLVTAIGAFWMRSGEAAKKAKEEVSDLEQALKSLDSTLAEWVQSKKAASMGITVEELVGGLGIEAVEEEIKRLEGVISNAKKGSGLRGAGQGALEEKQAGNLVELDKARVRLGEILSMQMAERIANYKEESSAIASQLELVRAQTKFGMDSKEAEAVARDQALDAELRGIDAKVANNTLSEDAGKLMKEQVIELAAAQVILDATTVINEGITAQKEAQRDVLIEQVAAQENLLNVEDAQAKKLAEAYEEAKKLAEEVKKASDAGVAMSTLNLAAPFETALPAARLLAQTMNIALSDALSLINAATAASGDTGPVGGGRGKSPGAGSTEVERTLLRMGGERGIPKAPKKAKGGGKGGGGGASKEDSAQKALEAYRQLVATYDEVEAKTLKVEAARKTLTEAERFGVISSQQSDEALKEYTKTLGDAKSPMLDLANTASQSLSQAFMAIVDGSKSASDAFGDMARTIIKQAFEMAVINPIINSLFGGVKGFSMLPSFFADGGVFSGGAPDKKFANGGVVGGPTTFPMAGGKTGLMGEAGPEAIMPLKRGKNGKLGVSAEGGGSQNITVVQNFNFQANGDESVKKIIAQAAPSISAMAQKGMMDQRRRGGAVKSTFG